MKLTLKSKLLALSAIATLALASIAIVGLISANDAAEQLDRIESRLIPRLELRPLLHADLDGFSRGLQDAVAAEDPELVTAAERHRTELHRHLRAAGDAVDPAQAAALRRAVDAYAALAIRLSRRMIAGETGEDILESVEAMQSLQARAAELIDRVSEVRPGELAAAFGQATDAQARSLQIQLWTSIACVLLVGLLSFLIGRQLLRSIHDLSAGFERFGRGELETPIALHGDDELTEAARRANEMAASLRTLNRARERTLFIGEGLTGLGDELRGEPSPAEVAGRATSFLARYLGAPAGALYAMDDGSMLRLLGRHAVAGDPEAAPSFRPGEGLVGQAALGSEPVVVESLPEDYSLRIRSGLGEAVPRTLVLLPLIASDQPTGVLELGFLGPPPEAALELLGAAGTTVAIAIEVARARAASRALLVETQALAARLTLQEEELRTTNEELESQQEELRQANEELTQQTDALEEHRKALEERNRELDRARQALELRASELAAMSAYKSQFLTNMSHELRTPLNSVLLLSNMLSENQGRNLTDKQVEYCRTIHTAGQDLLALINQVLDLARVESGKIELELEPVVLRRLTDQVAASFEPVARHKGLDLRIELDDGLPDAIRSDRQRLLQIVNNLLANALKFTERGSVTLRVGRPPAGADLGRPGLVPERTVTLEVEDTGPGIAGEHHERVFAAFEQADASIGRRHGGSGLGLAISRELAELLGGSLVLDSAPGAGSRFRCHLPEGGPTAETVAVSPAARRPQSRPPSAPAEERARTGSGLLIVEDDPAYSAALATLVREQGHEVWVASTGQDAIDLAGQHLPRGIILDVKLPDIDGFTVMERLRADARTALIPVHCVSGLDGAARALSLGAAGYVRKPASREELLGVVHSLAPRRRDESPRVLVVEDDAFAGESLVGALTRESFHARRVGTAAAARDALHADDYDCIILDLGLPDMDGLHLLAELEGRDAGRLPSVIVYTGRALTMVETRRLEAYTDAIVLKEGSSTERVLDEIRLFARRLADGRPASRPVASGPAPTADRELRGRSVLVVDDDMRTVYALSAMLRSKGFDVHVSDSGKAALDTLEEKPGIEAVLMDIMMPEMDGYTAMQRIRTQSRFGALPIIALTARAMKGDEEKCLAAGATAYLPKPVDSERLLEMLRALLPERA